MENNLNIKILEIYNNVSNSHDNIRKKLFEYITKAKELVELSFNMYQVEKTIRLNKISLKGYILDSPCCKYLEESNISNYKIEELKQYLLEYEQTSNHDSSSYYLAINLYETLEEIVNLIDNKIQLEINELSKLVPDISDIKNIDNSNYEKLYNQIINQLSDNYLNQNLIDNKSFSICKQIINDVFNCYINAYQDIPLDYI